MRCIIAVCCALLLGACAVRPHGLQVSQPDESDGEAAWFSYYREQFWMYRDAVLPPKDTASDAERRGYVRARSVYQEEQERTEAGFAVAALVGGFAVGYFLLGGLGD